MRTTARLLAGTALAGASIVLCTAGAAPAFAGDFETLEIRPSSATPGTYVSVSTRACGPDGSGTGDARSLGVGEFDLEPGKHLDVVEGSFRVPHHAKPGEYRIKVTCENGKKTTGDLTVKPADPDEPMKPVEPNGHVRTGVGGSVGTDTTQIAAGAAILAAAAVGGTVLLRRRASGTRSN